MKHFFLKCVKKFQIFIFFVIVFFSEAILFSNLKTLNAGAWIKKDKTLKRSRF